MAIMLFTLILPTSLLPGKHNLSKLKFPMVHRQNITSNPMKYHLSLAPVYQILRPCTHILPQYLALINSNIPTHHPVLPSLLK